MFQMHTGIQPTSYNRKTTAPNKKKLADSQNNYKVKSLLQDPAFKFITSEQETIYTQSGK